MNVIMASVKFRRACKKEPFECPGGFLVANHIRELDRSLERLASMFEKLGEGYENRTTGKGRHDDNCGTPAIRLVVNNGDRVQRR